MNFTNQNSSPTEDTNFKNINTQQITNDEANLRNLARTLKQSDILRDTTGQNIGQKMETEEKVPYNEIRSRLPTVSDQYRFLVDKKKIYLPKWNKKDEKPKWATEKYLVSVMLNKTLSLKKEEVKKPPEVTKKLTKGEILKILEGLVNQPLGFETDREPTNKWLITIIYSIKPDHEIFKPIVEEATKTIPTE